MRATPAAWKAFAFALAAIALEAAVDLRLRSGDEGGQAIDAATVRRRRLRLLILRLVALALLAMFARLVLMLLFARLILLMVALAGVAGERLLLVRHESRLLAEARKTLILLAIFRDHVDIRPGLLRLILAELLLGCRNEAEVMFGVLIVVLRRDRVARALRIARKLDVFFCNVRGGAPDLYVGAV